MCHVSSGGFPGVASQSPAKLSLQDQAPSRSSAMILCLGPAKPGFWERVRDTLMEPSEAPTGQREGPARVQLHSSPSNATRSLLLGHQEQNRLRWLQCGPFCPLGTAAKPPRLKDCCCSEVAKRSAGSNPDCTPRAPRFSKPGLPHWDNMNQHGPITWPHSQGPNVPVSPLGDSCSGVKGIFLCSMNFQLSRAGMEQWTLLVCPTPCPSIFSLKKKLETS